MGVKVLVGVKVGVTVFVGVGVGVTPFSSQQKSQSKYVIGGSVFNCKN